MFRSLAVSSGLAVRSPILSISPPLTLSGSGYKADIHWIVPTLSGLLTGFGLLAIFLQSLNYLVDAYLMFAASAIAANTFLRSLAGAGFPLFSQYMFKALGVNWAGTLLGCVALCLVPIPVCFLIYGERIRRKSAFAPTKPLTSEEEAEEPPLREEKTETRINGDDVV